MNKFVNAMALDEPKEQKTSYKLFEYIAYFALIDLLMLPYFPLLIMPYSLPIVLLGLFVFGKVKLIKFYSYYVVIVSLLIMMSFMTGALLGKSPEFLREDFLRMFQFLTTFLYFFYFYAVAKYLSTRVIKGIMLTAVVYVLLIAAKFLIDPWFLVMLREHLYTATAYRSEDVLEHFRFTYIFSDPNTSGYFFLMLVFFILIYFNNTFVLRILLLASAILVTILVQSIGATVSLAIVVIFVLFKGFIRLNGRSIFKSVVLFIGLCIILFIFLHFTSNDIILAVSRSFDMFKGRIMMNNPYESRLWKYPYAISKFIPFLWGQGYALLEPNGSIFRPHSDHIRLIYSYGIIVYAMSIYFFFRKIFRERYLFLIPAFIAFSVNSLIDEQKLFGLFLVLLALTDRKQYVEWRH
jgi:hypothetical protein